MEAGMVTTNETSAKARQSFSDILNRAAFGKERVVIERRGKRLAAVVPLEDLDLLEQIEDRIDLEDARLRMQEKGSVPWAKIRKELGI
jgi:prevent-host-death family protein